MKLRVFCSVMLMMCSSLTFGAETSSTRVAVVFSGGHETDPRDGGRPVVLIAGALGVPPDVFREVFSHVRPARGGEPEPSQVRENKAALMNGLGKYGVTNDRLDTVSNYYRYRREKGEMWPTKPAEAYAEVENGKVLGVVVTKGGIGYSSPPKVSVAGMGPLGAKVDVIYGADFDNNGSVGAVKLESGK